MQVKSSSCYILKFINNSWRENQKKSLPWRRFGYVILIIIKFCEVLLWISQTIINALRSYIKRSKECLIRYPNTLILVKKKNSTVPRFFNPLLSVWISDETLLLVFDILHEDTKNVSVKWLLNILSKTEMIGFVGSCATSSSVQHSYIATHMIVSWLCHLCGVLLLLLWPGIVKWNNSLIWKYTKRNLCRRGWNKALIITSWKKLRPSRKQLASNLMLWTKLECIVESFTVKVVELPRNCHHELS